jgi:hypothetical protein
MVHARFGIGGGQQFVGAAMTINAGGRVAIAALDRFRVKAAFVRRLLISVAGGASNFLGSYFVRRAFYVGMAVDAGEHAAVDGIFESLRIDVQADRLAIFLVGERGIAMASEAFVSSWF